MVYGLSNLNKNIIIFFIVGITLVVGFLYAIYQDIVPMISPASGFATAYYYLYRKRVLPGISASVLLFTLGYRLIFVDEVFYHSLVLAIVLTFTIMIEVHLFSVIVSKLKIKTRSLLNLESTSKLSGVVIGIAAVSVLLPSLIIGALKGFDGFGIMYFQFFIGHGVGILLFSSLIINAYFRDHLVKSAIVNIPRSIAYIATFVAGVVFIFGDFGNDFFTFRSYQLIIIILYTFASFQFSFRMIALNDMLLLIGIWIFTFADYQDDNYQVDMLGFVLFVITVSIISSVIRIILLERQENYDQMKDARKNLEKVFISTNEFLEAENKIPEEAMDFEERYLRNMFEIACKMYPKFNRASVNVNESKYVRFVATKGYDINHLNSLMFLTETFEWGLYSPKIIRTTDYDEVFEDQESTRNFKARYGDLKESIRFTVIIGENKHAGMSFDIYKDSDEEFNETDLANFVSFQNMMNSFYRLGILNKQKNQLKDDLVLSLVRTLELYDQYTGGHSEEVAHLCVEIGTELSLEEDQIRDLYWAGIVHDIGKIGLPNDILNKNGKLTDDEYALVKEHPMYGYNILSRSEGLEEIALIVKHHHEWWNGKGYPNGLRSIGIPYLAQILHVCDAVDAMAQDRVYRKALTNQEIIDELRKGLGRQFSPKIAKVMMKYIESGKFQNQNK